MTNRHFQFVTFTVTDRYSIRIVYLSVVYLQVPVTVAAKVTN